MKKIRILPYETFEKVPPPPEDADSSYFPSIEYKKTYQYAVKLLKAFYDKQIEKALKEVFSVYKNFITIEDLSRYIIYKIEEHTVLPDDIKEKLKKQFEKLYKQAKTKAIKFNAGFSQPDIQTIQFIDKLNDIYLGKFFQADQKVRLEVLNWIKKYYFEEGNPIGKGQKGIKEFLNKFGHYLKDKSDHKIRQIIDTTVNFVKTAAEINGYAQANIKEYVWDAVNDRLTCPACRSMDGRIIKTEQAIQQLNEILAKGLEARPIITTPYKGKTENIPVRFPPAHPLCRCQTYANIKKEQIAYTVERPPQMNNYWQKVAPQQEAIEAEYKNLTSEEIHNKVKAHQGSSWVRMSQGKIDLKEKNLKKHFRKRGVKLGLKSIEEYKKLTKEIITNPDEIYVQRLTDGETDFIFKKGKFVVISNDDYLYIKSMYILDKETIEQRIEKRANLGHGTIKIK